jgi:hypothetical protein
VRAVGLRERKKQQTRQSLLDAAACLFEERGYDNVTVAEIADVAGAPVKTMFTHFDYEDALTAAIGKSEPDLASAEARGNGTAHRRQYDRRDAPPGRLGVGVVGRARDRGDTRPDLRRQWPPPVQVWPQGDQFAQQQCLYLRQSLRQ